MANGHGGSRPGAGRKPKSTVLRSFDGGAGKRRAPAATVPVEVEEFDAPNSLTMEQRHVWMEFAPEAFQKRTLNKSTMGSFVIFCCNVIVMRGYYGTPVQGGSDHRGMIQRVQADLSAFSLRPCGKAIYEAPEDAQQPVNPLSRFTSGRRA